jgi:hypothetical protein
MGNRPVTAPWQMFAAGDDQVIRTAFLVWGMLALTSISIMGLGLLWLIVGCRRFVKKEPRRTVYYDLSIGNEFEEFENPFNEPDLPEDHGPTLPKS